MNYSKSPKQPKQTSKVTLIQSEEGVGNTINLDALAPKKCVGCGTKMQTDEPTEPGYVQNVEVQDYCLRCFKIKHYNQLVDQEIDDRDFIAILDDINKQAQTLRYYYTLDVFDLPGSRISWLEHLIAKKEVIVVINKIDLLPKELNHNKLIKYVHNLLQDSPIKDAKIILTSSVLPKYLDNLYNAITSVTYDQYIVGVSNAGKSSLINALLQKNNQVPSIVTSKYVNTTLDKIKINLTKTNYIYDTPGLVKYHHMALVTTPTYWNYFFFRKPIKQRTFQLKPGQTIFYGGLAWMSFTNGNNELKTSFHFWVNREIKLHRTKADNTQAYFRIHRHTLVPRLKEALGKVKFETITFAYKENDNLHPVDIHISGLGWISFTPYAGLKITISVPQVEQKITVVSLPSLIND